MKSSYCLCVCIYVCLFSLNFVVSYAVREISKAMQANNFS
jgi:hypothetical protein